MNQLEAIISDNPEYQKGLEKITSGLVLDQYVVTKKQAMDYAIDKLNNKMMTQAIETVVVGYEDLLEEQQNTIEKITHEKQVLSEELQKNNIPLPTIDMSNVGTISRTSTDSQKLSTGLNRMNMFLKNSTKPGDKISITTSTGVKKAYRVVS